MLVKLFTDNTLNETIKSLKDFLDITNIDAGIYTINYQNQCSLIELVSYIFGGIQHSLYMYNNIYNYQINYKSLPILFSNIIGCIEIPDMKTFVLISKRSKVISKFDINSNKFIYSYIFRLFNQFPNAVVLKAEFPQFEQHCLFFSAQFYYDQLLAQGLDVKLHTNEINGQVLYSYNEDTRECYNNLVEKYGIIIPMKLCVNGFLGFYLQITGWTITYKDDNWIGIKDNTRFGISLKRKISIHENNINTPIDNFTVIDLYEDYVNVMMNSKILYKLEIYGCTKNLSLFAAAKICCEYGLWKAPIKHKNGCVEVDCNFYNYTYLEEVMLKISKCLNIYIDTEFDLINFKNISDELNTSDLAECMFTFHKILGDKYGVFYDVETSEIMFIFPKQKSLKEMIESIILPPVTIDSDDLEPITCESYNEMSDRCKALLIPFGNPVKYYTCSSLIKIFENEDILARDPLKRNFISMNEKNQVYNKCSQLLGLTYRAINYNYNTDLIINKEEQWVNIYLEWNDNKYPIAYLPLIYEKIDEIINLIEIFHKHQLLLHPHFNLDYSVNNMLHFSKPLEVFSVISNKNIWIEQNQRELYMWVIDELKPYF